MNKEAFIKGFYKKSFIGKAFGLGFLGLDLLDTLKRAKNWGNRSRAASLKAPSFYTYRKLPRVGNYRM
jgi:hypothetical protein